ncbi:MAG TPA: site-2 protease family protein [Kiloniellales bacterium]
MPDKHWSLFKLFGINVQIDASWLILALLVTWSLAQGVFPHYYPDLRPATYWSMGFVSMIGLVLSIVLHETSHALVARRHGLPISKITLFVFGGVAELTEEPKTARTEFLMAIAGPIASGALALGFFVAARLLVVLDAPTTLQGVTFYLAGINGLLAAFNLLPAFPLDGGRVLRAALWHWRGDLHAATRTASRNGELFGFALILLGVFNVIGGNFIGGMWWFLIGLFLRQAAKTSYIQLWTQEIFKGEPVHRFMSRDPVAAPDDITVAEFVRDYVYAYHHDLFPVTHQGHLTGYVLVRDIKKVPQESWDRYELSALATPCTEDNTISSRSDVLRALAQMRRTGNSRLMVVEGDELVGVLVLKDLLELIALKIDLEGPD